MRTVAPMAQGGEEVTVRFYDKEMDLARVVEFERSCETANGGQAILQDVLGDPLCRVRHFPGYSMLVAEIGSEIVGIIRAGIKVVVCGNRGTKSVPVYARAGYLLGLRVSAAHRRLGIGFKLASRMEEWCKEQGVEYVYFATTKDNEASVKLFTKRLQYIPFRHPAILIQPVYGKSRPSPGHIEFTKLSVEAATAFYKSRMGSQEFFPKDIDRVLGSKLCAGTWVATLRQDRPTGLCCGGSCRVSENYGSIEDSFAGYNEEGRVPARPESWAVLSLWKCNEIFKLEVKGVSLAKRTFALMSRLLEKSMPWFRIPSIPNFFTSFGMQFLFGLHAEGSKGHELMTSLCWHAHNISRDSGCQALMTEVGGADPLKKCIPHWNMFSSDDDLWCVKSLLPSSATAPGLETDRVAAAAAATHPTTNSDLQSETSSRGDWCWAPSMATSKEPRLFVDPRDV